MILSLDLILHSDSKIFLQTVALQVVAADERGLGVVTFRFDNDPSLFFKLGFYNIQFIMQCLYKVLKLEVVDDFANRSPLIPVDHSLVDRDWKDIMKSALFFVLLSILTIVNVHAGTRKKHKKLYPIITKLLTTYPADRPRDQRKQQSDPGAQLTISDQVRNSVLKNLNFLASLKFEKTSPLFNFFFGEHGSVSLMEYLNSNIDNFYYDPRLSGFRAPTGSADGNRGVGFGVNYLQSHFSRVEKASGIIHEARHNQGPFQHELCPPDFRYSSTSGVRLAGLPACDTTPFGAYGVQIIFLRNVARYCSNCDLETKRAAREVAENALHRILDRQARETLVDD